MITTFSNNIYKSRREISVGSFFNEIVIMEIKNGPSAQLTPVERKIRKLVEDGMVRWELLERSCHEDNLPEEIS